MPYRPSRWGKELRYALRSLERFYPQAKNVVIIAETFPVGLNPERVDFICSTSSVDSEFRRLAGESQLVTDEYLWFNDDYFILNDFEERDLTGRYVEAVTPAHLKLAAQTQDAWQRTVWQAIEILIQQGLPTFNYALHCPTLFRKSEVRETLQHFAQYFSDPTARFATPHFETLHFNWHYHRRGVVPRHQDTDRIQFFANSRQTVMGKSSDYKFMFYDDTCPGRFLSAFLEEREPRPSRYEK